MFLAIAVALSPDAHPRGAAAITGFPGAGFTTAEPRLPTVSDAEADESLILGSRRGGEGTS